MSVPANQNNECSYGKAPNGGCLMPDLSSLVVSYQQIFPSAPATGVISVPASPAPNLPASAVSFFNGWSTMDWILLGAGALGLMYLFGRD